MDEQLVTLFVSQVREHFEFLVLDYGFAEPLVELRPDVYSAIVVFMGNNVAIEFVLDEREEHIECRIARVVDGERSRHYAVDENRRRVRENLFGLLRRRGVTNWISISLAGLSLEKQIPRKLDALAKNLRANSQDILADLPGILD